MSLAWVQVSQYALATEPAAFTIAKIYNGPDARYELWDCRGRPAELIGWHTSAAAAKAEAEEIAEGVQQ